MFPHDFAGFCHVWIIIYWYNYSISMLVVFLLFFSAKISSVIKCIARQLSNSFKLTVNYFWCVTPWDEEFSLQFQQSSLKAILCATNSQ